MIRLVSSKRDKYEKIKEYDRIVQYSQSLRLQRRLPLTTARVTSVLAHYGAVSSYQLRRGIFLDIFGTCTDAQIYYVLKDLQREGYVVKKDGCYYVTSKFFEVFAPVTDESKVRNHLYHGFGSVIFIDSYGIKKYAKKNSLPYSKEILESCREFENSLMEQTDERYHLDECEDITHVIAKRYTHYGQMDPSIFNIDIQPESENDPIIASADRLRAEIITIGYNEVSKHMEWLENYHIMHGQITEGPSVLLFVLPGWRFQKRLKIAVQPGTESWRAFNYFRTKGILRRARWADEMKPRRTKTHTESTELAYNKIVDGCVVPPIPGITEKLLEKCKIVDVFNALGITICRNDLLENQPDYVEIILTDIKNRVRFRNRNPSLVAARIRSSYN